MKKFSELVNREGPGMRWAWLQTLFAAMVIMLCIWTSPASAATVTLSAPDGGEVLNIGGTYNIEWNYSGTYGITNSADIELSTNSGSTWTTIGHVTSPVIGAPAPEEYSWTVPNLPTNQARIRITVYYTTFGSGLDPFATNTYEGGTVQSSNFTIAAHVISIPVWLQAPTNLTATTVSNSKIDLDWTHNSVNETGFSIQRKTGAGAYTTIDEVAANTFSYTDSGLAAATTYTYRVKAVGNGGTIHDSGYSNEDSAQTSSLIIPPIILPQWLSAPANLSASAVSSSKIDLDWTDKSSGETGFSIERKLGSGTFSEIDQVAANTESYSDSGLAAGKTYTYRVKAISSGLPIHDSSYSNEDSATTNADSSQPAAKVLRFYIGGSDYFVNNQIQTMDTVPMVLNDRTLLPITYVATPLGATVNWNEAEEKVTIVLNNTTIEMWIGQNTAKVNGILVSIDPNNSNVMPIVVPPGRTMLPLRFIAENLNCQVDWDPLQQMVTVTYPKS